MQKLLTTRLTVTQIVFNILSLCLLCISTGTNRWKKDISYRTDVHSYIGLWEGCVEVRLRSVQDFSSSDGNRVCDKDFLTPKNSNHDGGYSNVPGKEN